MENTKVTKKDLYNGIIDFVNGKETAVTVDEIVAFCEKEIENLAKKAAKAKENAAKKRAEADELQEAVAAALTTDFEPIATIAGRIEGEDVTVAKCTYRLNKLVENGIAEKQAIKVSGSDGKKNRTIQGYRRKMVDAE